MNFKKLRIKYILIFLILLAGIYSIHKIKQTKDFPVQQVKIYGVKNANAQEMQQKLIPIVSKGFFAVDVDSIKEELLQMPWVAEVSVRQIWPNQIMITVTEHNPIARWNENKLLSSTGEIFNPDVSTYPPHLPQFIGPEGKQILMLELYSKMDNVLQPLNLKVARLELTPYLSWDVEFVNGIKMRLGYKDILTRVNHFVKVYPKIIGERAAAVDYVDLRYPNGLAVRWKVVS